MPSAVRWPQVETAYVSYNVWQGTTSNVQYVGPPNEQARQQALVQFYQNDNPTAARDSWRQQTEPPRDPTELAMLADLSALGGESGAALSYIARLRAYQPAEADALLATLGIVEKRLPAAAAAVEAATTRLRTDPWPLRRLKERVIQIAQVVGSSGDRTLARRMLAALAQPLALQALEDFRLLARAEMTRTSGDSRGCAARP
jgi:hypothetical protein